VATKEQLKEAIQRALDDDNMEAASELRDRYLALEAQEQPQEVEQPKPEVIEEQPKKDLSWFDEFEFAYDSSHTDVSNWGLALEAYSPMGEITIGGEDGLISYQSPRELYGDAFVDKMSYDERRDFLLQRREQSVLEEHKDVIIFQEEEGKSGSAEAFGTLVGTFLTPTTLAPVGYGVAGTAKAAGLLGLQIEAAEQTAEGDLDVVDLAKSTVVAAAGGAAVAKTGQAATKAFKLVKAKRQAKKEQKALDNLSSKVEDELITGASEGLQPKQNFARARRNLGITSSEAADLVAHGKIKIPSQQEAAKVAAAKANPIVALHKTRKVLDSFAAPVSTVVRNISEPVFGRLRKFEYDTHSGIQKNIEQASEFMTLAAKARKGANAAQYSKFEAALFNGDFQKADNIARASFPELLGPLQKVTGPEGVLNVLHKELRANGVDVGFVENYFPRSVKELGKLLNSFGKTEKTRLEEALSKEAKRQKLGSWKELDPTVTTDVINRVLRGGRRSAYQIGLAKRRSIQEVDETLKDFYYSAPESLSFYINSAVREIEKRKFFGKNVSLDDSNKVDLEASIGNFVREPLLKGEISPEQADDLAMLLQARFVTGEKSGSVLTTTAKDIQTGALLAQFDSAVIQLADIGASVYMNGFRNTVRSLVPAARKKTETSAEEIGVINNISADINTNGILANSLDRVMTYSGFKFIDRLGKDTFISAAHKNNTQLALKNPEKITNKWRATFGDETQNLIEDLRAGRMTDNVKLLLFNQLSDIQPITLSEMPQKYLEAPNGRILYALKSFAIKQLDIMRRDFAGQVAKGNYKEGFTNLANYAASIGLAGGSVGLAREAMQTKEFNIDEFPDKVFETWMALAFMNKYARERQLSEGGIGQWSLGIVTPAVFNMADEAGKSLVDLATQEEDSDSFNKAMAKVPVIGKAAYYWLLGGAERKIERDRKEEEKQRRRKLGIN
jgi:hypothetical protein